MRMEFVIADQATVDSGGALLNESGSTTETSDGGRRNMHCAMTRNKGSNVNKRATTHVSNLQHVGTRSTHARLNKPVTVGSKSKAGTSIANAFDALDSDCNDSVHEQQPDPGGVNSSPSVPATSSTGQVVDNSEVLEQDKQWLTFDIYFNRRED